MQIRLGARVGRATEQIASGLWRWTAPHLEWEPNATPDSLADWEQHVGSVPYEISEHTVFFDPLLPPHPDEFWRWADQHVAARPHIRAYDNRLHKRSRPAFVERYGASTSRAKNQLPHGVESFVVKIVQRGSQQAS